MTGGLVSAPLPLEAATESEMGIVVHRRDVEHRSELALGFPKAPDPEVCDPQGLSDRRLRGFAPLRLFERNRRLSRVPRREMAAALLVEVVGLAHRLVVNHARRHHTVRERRLRAPRARLDVLS